ncbi:MAG TPA: polysaccharide pyruvyl transferase family protein [Clostridiaceae bacterium]|nr:polysaccharide pyruvyl transferase family protein [Clostridiaceae bacterium]
MKIAIIGYYGHNNLGDELNLLEMIKLIQIQYPKADITIFSGGLGTLYYDVDYNLVLADRLGVAKYRDTLNKYDLVIIGGGGLIFLGANYFDFLQEGLKVPYIFSRVGIDNRIVSQPVLAQLKSILDRAYDVTVRTSFDRELAQKYLGIECGVVPEAIWNYEAQPFPLAAHGKKIMVSMNAYASKYFAQIKEALTKTKTTKTTFTVSMQDTSKDFYYNIMSTPDKRVILPESVSLHKKASFLASMDIVITSRLHAGLVAISHGIPAIMLKSTPKVQFLMKELDLNEFFVDGVINESIIDDILSRDMAPRLKGISKHMKQLSKAPIILD